MTQPPPPPIPPQGGPARQGNLMLLIIAVVLGVVTAMLSYVVMAGYKNRSKQQTMTVWQFSRSIQRGEKIKKDYLQPVTVPREFKDKIFKDIYTQGFEIDAEVSGQVAPRNIPSGAYVRAFWVNRDSVNSGTMVIHEDQEAIDLPVERATAPQYLRPGDSVNLRATFTLPRSKKIQTIVIAKDVKVQRINGQADFTGSGRRNTKVEQITVVMRISEVSQLRQALQYATGKQVTVTMAANNTTALKPSINAKEIDKIVKAIDAERVRVSTTIIDRRDSSSDNSSTRGGSGRGTSSPNNPGTSSGGGDTDSGELRF